MTEPIDRDFPHLAPFRRFCDMAESLHQADLRELDEGSNYELENLAYLRGRLSAWRDVQEIIDIVDCQHRHGDARERDDTDRQDAGEARQEVTDRLDDHMAKAKVDL